MVATLTSTDLDSDRCPKCGERLSLQKRPVAFRVGPFDGKWAIYQDEEAARIHADGWWDHPEIKIQGLYVCDGT